jgi:hypothetical protein
MDHISTEHVRRNVVTRNAWEGYSAHRRIVSEHLVRGRPSGAGRLCVLGAGNSNDLDLALLSATFAEIHLVDLDAAALLSGLSRQEMLYPDGDPSPTAEKLELPVERGPHLREKFAAVLSPERRAQIRCYGYVDVTGIVERLGAWRKGEPSTSESVTACVEAARLYSPPLPTESFDVVASTCLLTQLIDSVAMSLGADHPRFMELMLAVRDRHLRLLVELLAPGGLGVLVTDIVSSDTCPALLTAPEDYFSVLTSRQVDEGNFFTGANPRVLQHWFTNDVEVGPLVERVQLVRPWQWRVGPRAFAVCAVKVLRREA